MTSGAPVFDAQDEGPAPSGTLARAAVGGVAWQGLSYLLGKLMVLASTIVLARLLAPSDFGVVGLALVFVAYVEGITDLGVAEALVYLPRGDRANDHAFTLSLIWSCLLTGAAFLLAPAVASFFHRPEITWMFRVLSLSLIVRGLAEVPDALLRKNLRFRQRLVADMTRVVAQGVVSISLAFAGLGPWSIVYGYLAANTVWAATVWVLVSYRPSRGAWRIEWDVARPMVAYGLPAAGNVLLLSLVFDVDYLIVGRVLGPRALGFYTLGFRLPELVIINVFFVLSSVAFPVYTRTGGDRARLGKGYLRAVRIQSVYGVGAGVGLAVVAPMLVHVVFGAKWDPSIVPLEALALYAAFRAVGIGPVDVYKSIGRPGLAVAMSVLRLGAVVPALLIATHFGVVGVSWAQAVVALLLAVMMQTVAARVLGLPLRALAAAVAPSLVLAAFVAAASGAVRVFVPGPEALRLALALLAGVAAGLAGLHVAARSFLPELRALLRRDARGGTAPAPAADPSRQTEPVRS